ncbi:MAG: hypothetical protein Q8M08_13400 [Bacteroidales bacterium]|nr:hypothetical protein [Bacteroidales bacterium]
MNIECRTEGTSWPGYHSTFDIIRAVEAGRFDVPVMMTFHPQRWHDKKSEGLILTKFALWPNISDVKFLFSG